MPSTSFQKISTAVLPLLTLIACSSTPTSTQANLSNTQIQAAWVVLGEQGQATARVITEATGCPTLLQDGVPKTMNVRAMPASVEQRSAQSKPSAFPVLTCEFLLADGVQSVSVGERNLPVPKLLPLKILVLGDTGCRLKAADHAFQSCDDVDQWAFSTVAKTAANFAPDLVVHVGDYHYRESPCPANNAGCAGSPWGYGWDTWQADFFAPAAPLLAAAPWVMARGNHETCSRAGQGWWRFLDPRALQQGRDCNSEINDDRGDYSAPYAVPLGAGAQLIVFDSSKAPVKAFKEEDPAYQIYLKQYKAADQLAQQADFSLFLEHHPVLGFAVERNKSNRAEIKPGNLALQNVLQAIHPQRLFDPKVEMLLAGHVHLFEALIFKSDHPTQFVAGNGGSSPDANLPAVLPSNATPFKKAKVDQVISSDKSGFMTMERASAKATTWVIKAWDKDGVLKTNCQVSKLKSECSTNEY